MKKLNRKALVVNGVERFFLYDIEKDTLAVALRRFGLTGTKIGCGIGVCGACSVIVNGKVVRTCNLKMDKVPAHSEITTIEGIGGPNNLHPLQRAWFYYGAAQCGFCSPGFIVSAYGLLQENPAPTREEVREWFRVHKNICRCTGYKPIVDAVMAAAAVMRGDAPLESIIYDPKSEKDIYGSKQPRPTGVAKVTGQFDYGGDIALKMPDSTAHLALVLSEVAHGKLLGLDTAEAEAMPGVIKIITAKDIKGTNNIGFPAFAPRQKGKGMTDFPLICSEAINKYGDVLAVVAADTRDHARDAAKKVKPNIEVLPAYETYPEAVVPNALQLHKTIPNFYMEQPVLKGEDTEDIFDDAPIVVESSFHSQHEPHLPIESDIVQAYWDADGKMTVQSKTQNLSESLGSIAPAIGLAPEQVRFIMNPSGGAFGYTIVANMMGVTAACALALDMPVSHELSYDEFNHTSGKRAATWTNGRIAVDENGKVAAVEYDMACDHGCYAGSAPMIFNNFISVGFHGYNIPNAKALARGGSSNSAFGTAYRGFGAPQVYTTTEALMDMAARKAGIDPWQFRYDNAARPGDTTLCNRHYSEYVYPQLLEMIKPYYDEYKKLAEEGKAEGKHTGCGISLGGFHLTTGAIDWAEVDLELLPDGNFRIFDTWEDVGQGGDIGSVTHVVKALAPLGITADQVKLTMNDFSADKEKTVCPDMGLAAASRCHYMGGNAIIDAANKLMDAMRKADGTYRTYDEMVAEGIPTKYRGHYDQFNIGLDHGLDPNNGEGHTSPTYMYTVNTCLVEVDVNTGKTKVLKYTCASDVGVIGNRLAVEGQAYGGLSHSIGFALSEDYYGDKKHGNMAGCGVPTIDVIPDDFNLLFLETYRKDGPHGSAGCSEGYQSSGHMAVINAIDDACGVRVTILPATPDKVKAGWAKVQAGEDQTPPKYFLGSDFEDEMELIAANPM